MGERDGWRTALLAREAFKNVFAVRSRLFPVLVLAVVLGAALASFDVYRSAAFVDTLDQLGTEGRNVLVVEARGPEGRTLIDRQSCEALSTVPGVERAGALWNPSVRDVAQLGPDVRVRPVSDSLVVDLQGRDAVVGRALAETAGLAAGDVTLRIGAETVDASVAPDLGAEVETSLALFVTAPATQREAPQCAVVLTAFADRAGMEGVVASQLRARGGALAVRSGMTETFDVVEQYLHRPERLLPFGLGLLGALIVAGARAMRSSELAVYRLSGMTRRSLSVLLWWENALLAGAFVTASAAASAALLPWAPNPVGPVLWALAGGAAWVATALLACFPVLHRRPTDLAKDR